MLLLPKPDEDCNWGDSRRSVTNLSALGKVLGPDLVAALIHLVLKVDTHTFEAVLYGHVDLRDLHLGHRGHQLGVVQSVVGASSLEDLSLLVQREVLVCVVRVNVFLV